MFVRKLPQGEDMSDVSKDQLINKAMGVRVPPRRREVLLGMERGEICKGVDESRSKPFDSPILTPIATATLHSTNAAESDDILSADARSAEKASFASASEIKQDLSKKEPEAGRPTKSQSGLEPLDERALESVKITAPGTYELNLPSLFERDELIMAVKEGTYFIDLTSAFKKSKKE